MTEPDTTTEDKHVLLERDVAIVTFKSQYNADNDIVEFIESDVGDSLGSYDAELSCTCGVEFDSYENAVTHLKHHTKK